MRTNSQRPSKGNRHFKQRSPALWELLTVTERRNKLHNSLLSHIALFITTWLNSTRKWAEFQKCPFWFRKRHSKFRRQECGKNTVSPMNTHQKDSRVEGHIWLAPLCWKHLLAWWAETTQHNVRFMGLSTEGRTGVSPSALGVLAFRKSPACVTVPLFIYSCLVSFFRESCLERAQTTHLPYFFTPYSRASGFLVRTEATKKL